MCNEHMAAKPYDMEATQSLTVIDFTPWKT